MEALKTLCGNDKQYVLAMVALSQSGPSGVLLAKQKSHKLVTVVENFKKL